MLSTTSGLYPCVTPRAWDLLAAVRHSRGKQGDLIAAIEFSLEIARQVVHRKVAGMDVLTVFDEYSADYGCTLRVEHVALGLAEPFAPLTLAQLPVDVQEKTRYIARMTGRTAPDVLEWSAELAAHVLSDRPAARALKHSHDL